MTEQNIQDTEIPNPFEEVEKFQPSWKMDIPPLPQRLVMDLAKAVYERTQASPLVNPSDPKFLRIAREVALRDWLMRAKNTIDPQKPNRSREVNPSLKSGEEEARTPFEKMWNSLKEYFRHREFEKIMKSMNKTLMHPNELNQEQLTELVKLVCQTKSVKEKNELFVLIALRERFKLQERQIKTRKLMVGLATFGTLATLAFGSARSETSEQMAMTMVATSAMAAVTVAARKHAEKKQAQHDEEEQTVRNYHPATYQRFQQLRTILNG